MKTRITLEKFRTDSKNPYKQFGIILDDVRVAVAYQEKQGKKWIWSPL